jgi:hypothetical protein
VLEAEASATGTSDWHRRDEGRTEERQVLVIVRTSEEASATARIPDDRARTIWTVDELARCVALFEQVSAVERAFPGAQVTAVSPAPCGPRRPIGRPPIRCTEALHPHPLDPGEVP